MADTPNYNLPYPDDYTQLADVPAAVKALAEATDTALEGKADTSDIPDLTDYVQKTDYASGSNAGVIKGQGTFGFMVNASGVPYADPKTYENYLQFQSYLFISKGTLENVLAARIGAIDEVLDAINGEVI